MLDIKWTGGSEADRKAVSEQYEAYLVANSKFDDKHLESIYSTAPYSTYYNMNGHTYDGRDHWIKLWKYYVSRIKTGYWKPFDIAGVISGDLATVWSHRETRTEWVGEDKAPTDREQAKTFVSRSTMVFQREADGWRCIHVHFSPSKLGEERPGGI